MREFSFKDNGHIYKRISKAEARRIYRTTPVLICASNLMPLGKWCQGAWMREDVEFDKIVNEYEFYNCVNRETGTYASFYKEIWDD